MAGSAQALTADAGASPSSEAAASVLHPLSLSLLGLTFTTGLIDATSYLGLGRVFTANMTGNVVLLGFGIAHVAALPVISPIVSMMAFFAGALAGGVLASRTAHRHSVNFGWALAIEVALVAVAAVVAAANPHPAAFARDLIIALLAFAMGVRNATVRRIAVPDLTTTVLTMTLTGLAADSRLAGGSGKGSARRIGALVTMLAGALTGALLLKTSLSLPLVAAAVVALLTLLAYIPRRARYERRLRA